MLVVRAYVVPYFNRLQLRLLPYACSEIIPAGLHSELGPLKPGSIEFAPVVVFDGLKSQVLIDVEADYQDDRAKDIAERTKRMKMAFNELIPGTTFSVCTKLVYVGWSSDVVESDFDGDMSMEAAIERYNAHISHAFGS